MNRNTVMKDADKLIQYVKKGALHKVKRHLRRWKKEGKIVQDVKTGNGRTLLHLACYHGEDAIARVLLRTGCAANTVDKDGNTPLHLALNRVLEGNIHLMFDLVEPLLQTATSDDIIQGQRNDVGVTPALLLKQARNYVAERTKPSSSHHASWHDEEKDEDKDWNEKLASEWAYENEEVHGHSYWTSFNGNDEKHCTETYDDWSERISTEYHAKLRSSNTSHHKKAKKTKDKSKANEKLLSDLQKEHEKYQQRQTDKRLKRKKEEYLTIADRFFSNSNDSDILGYGDIPWPGHMSNVDGMLKVLLHGVETESLKKFVLSQLRFWHPDKFQQKLGQRLHAEDSEQILKQVNELSQGLNKLIEDKE
ncbi:NF-kappa-B inhibitor-like protein 1 [Anneissia japonica]|uniref:NF-kappa-B inhibitor-like protein 1 n=1 Tax=Anneissia japonica TaxID=1529436 RepID=UPI0014256BC7|nr:NF-kappa-B inhibitor-like protein 1 [Anneissia japonica]